MKEVIEQTGLTDRAVRLYITNGLVNPVCQKSYSGRNSFEFTEYDIVQLNQIALLRKAGFSLEQIKALQIGGNEAKTAFNIYLIEKQHRYEQDGVILQTLNDIASEEMPTIEELCHRLQESFQEQQLPTKDMVMSIRERIGLVGWWIIWGIVAAIYGWMVLSLLAETSGRFPYIHIS